MIKSGWTEETVIGTGKRLKVYYEDGLGQKQGCYVEFYPGTDKLLNIQRYVDNLRDGRSFIIDPNGDISSIVYYKDNLRHGPSKNFYKIYYYKGQGFKKNGHLTPSEIYSFYQLNEKEGENIEVSIF